MHAQHLCEIRGTCYYLVFMQVAPIVFFWNDSPQKVWDFNQETVALSATERPSVLPQ